MAPIVFAAWIWSLTHLIPEKHGVGVAAKIGISLFIVAPWIWHAARCTRELRRRIREHATL
jgi:hypothetical protein